jgi:hypothetical protein
LIIDIQEAQQIVEKILSSLITDVPMLGRHFP